MTFRGHRPIGSVIWERDRCLSVKYGHRDSIHMASRRGYSAFLVAAFLLMLSGLSVLYLETDGSDGINEGLLVMVSGDDVTVTGHGTLMFDPMWNGLETLKLVPEGGTIDIRVTSRKLSGMKKTGDIVP